MPVTSEDPEAMLSGGSRVVDGWTLEAGAYWSRLSKSPSLAPWTSAWISARVYINAGPLGSLELRTAMWPPGSNAISTQLPCELLYRLFCHLTWRNCADSTATSVPSSLAVRGIVMIRSCLLEDPAEDLDSGARRRALNTEAVHGRHVDVRVIALVQIERARKLLDVHHIREVRLGKPQDGERPGLGGMGPSMERQHLQGDVRQLGHLDQALVLMDDAVQGEQVGDVAFLEADSPQFHPADLGFGSPDQVPGVLAADALGLAKSAQLGAEHDAQDSRPAGRADGWAAPSLIGAHTASRPPQGPGQRIVCHSLPRYCRKPPKAIRLHMHPSLHPQGTSGRITEMSSACASASGRGNGCSLVGLIPRGGRDARREHRRRNAAAGAARRRQPVVASKRPRGPRAGWIGGGRRGRRRRRSPDAGRHAPPRLGTHGPIDARDGRHPGYPGAAPAAARDPRRAVDRARRHPVGPRHPPIRSTRRPRQGNPHRRTDRHPASSLLMVRTVCRGPALPTTTTSAACVMSRTVAACSPARPTAASISRRSISNNSGVANPSATVPAAGRRGRTPAGTSASTPRRSASRQIAATPPSSVRPSSPQPLVSRHGPWRRPARRAGQTSHASPQGSGPSPPASGGRRRPPS